MSKTIERQGVALQQLSDIVRQMEKDIKPLLDLNNELQAHKERQAQGFGHHGSFSSRKGTKEMSAAELKNFILHGGA